MQNPCYSTRMELDFLSFLGIGKFSPDKSDRLNRREALKAYQAAARRRTDWGTIEPHKIFDYLARQLAV